MISTNDQGDIVKVEQHPVSRDEIVNKQSDLLHEQHRLQVKLDKVTSDLATANDDLAAYDRLVGTPEQTTGQVDTETPPTAEVEIK